MIVTYALGGFVVGYVGYNAFRSLQSRLDDVALGNRDHWWSSWHPNPLTFVQLVDMYRQANESMRHALRDNPPTSWIRPYRPETR